jgi:hypothetical protein
LVNKSIMDELTPYMTFAILTVGPVHVGTAIGDRDGC